MSVKNNVPEIRFKGFCGNWQNKAIGSILAETKRPVELLDNELYQLVTVRRRNEGVVPRATLKGKNILVKNYYGVKAGDYLISKRQVVHGANGIVPESLDNAVVSNEYLVVTDSDEVTAKFLTVISKRPEMHKLFFISSYGVDIEKLVFDVSDWKNRSITIPDVTEQNSITDYFQKLDNLINQHQQKHDKLNSIKKAMLEKMFPKQGETIPEIRFKGFSGEWVEVTLGEYAIFTKGQGYSKSDLSESGTPIVLYGRLYTKYQTVISQVDTFAIEKSKSVKSVGNEVIVPASGESSEDIARASAVCESGVILGGDLNIIYPNDEINPVFLALVISNGYPQKALASKAQGKSVVHIRNRDLAALLFTMPKKEEQTAIGNYFQKLDVLINQHQQQITKLNNIKQACLSKMFV
ncbi:restriction endonuclease subunit S [Aeromonas rivipollensis]|uniref:Restriction endonuclease subunit S n=1 Tax=Aeromonas rivipollensis TaxID=948519 RepID=A0AAW9YD95_9GAMM|nr:restriction endonuclease subunit S [Aeromonas rivipollensis]NEX75818.1 restriction endonuclease subunit S [Aeromonas rivipollensis]